MRVLALCLLFACDHGTEHSVAAAVRQNVTTRRHVTDELAKFVAHDLELPRRGGFWVRGGLGANGPVIWQVAFDVDAKTAAIVVPAEHWDPAKPPAVRALDAGEASQLWTEATATWTAGKPANDDVTDYMEYLVIVDGDDAYEVAARGPIHPSPAATLIAHLEKLHP